MMSSKQLNKSNNEEAPKEFNVRENCKYCGTALLNQTNSIFTCSKCARCFVFENDAALAPAPVAVKAAAQKSSEQMDTDTTDSLVSQYKSSNESIDTSTASKRYKSYALRNGNTARHFKKSEPELIELSDSDEEMRHCGEANSDSTCANGSALNHSSSSASMLNLSLRNNCEKKNSAVSALNFHLNSSDTSEMAAATDLFANSDTEMTATTKSRSTMKAVTSMENVDVADDSIDENELTTNKNMTTALSEKSNKQRSELKAVAAAAAVTGKPITYSFEQWKIKANDLEPLDKILNQEGVVPHSANDTASTNGGEFCIDMKCTFVRISSYSSDDVDSLSINEEGIHVKSCLNGYLISIIIGKEDIHYCICMFHDSMSMICFRINESCVEIFLREMKKIDEFAEWLSIPDENDINYSCLVVVVNLKKEEYASVSRKLYSYVKTLPQSNEYPLRLGFLKLERSKEFMSKLFENDRRTCAGVEKFLKGSIFNLLPRTVIKYPHDEQCETTVITNDDLFCLNEGEFLNDNIISFYLKYLQYEILTEEDRKKTHIFNTFFYHRLTTKTNSEKKSKENAHLKAAQNRHLRVKNWTRNVNLFEKDFIIIPINKNAHWYLAIICYPYLRSPIYDESKCAAIKTEDTSESLFESNAKKNNDLEQENDKFCMKPTNFYDNQTLKSTVDEMKLDGDSTDEADDGDDYNETLADANKVCLKRPVILIFDSLSYGKKARVIATLRQYLECEWRAKNKNDATEENKLMTIPGLIVEVPSQNNYFDCGIFLLQYVESFFKNPIKAFNSPINLRNWFEQSTIEKKRYEIRRIILLLENKCKSKQTTKMSVANLNN